MPLRSSLIGIGLVVLGSACEGASARECHVGADCASGMCQADGQCAVGPASTSSGDASADARDERLDASANDASSDAGTTGCSPNHDGTITRAEIPIAAGQYATYRVATDEDVTTAGVAAAGGRRIWDFGKALASDSDVLAKTTPLDGTWYASSFQGATYTTPLRSGSDLLGVFETTQDAFTLRGVVSPDDGVTRTELTYDAPATVLAFPLRLGSKWSTSSTVSGLASGVLATYTEAYASEVDAAGDLTTPLGTFDVLRVRIELTRTVGLLVTKVKSFAFVTECYGTIATIVSRDNEPNVEFTHAVEIRRIAP